MTEMTKAELCRAIELVMPAYLEDLDDLRENAQRIRLAINEVDQSQEIISRKGEAQVGLVFDSACEHPEFLSRHFHGGIKQVAKEFVLQCGRADRLFIHDDGTYTVIEIKQGGARRDQAAGIGQCLLYAAEIRGLPDAKDVRCALVVSGDEDEWIRSACMSASVEYVCFSHRQIEEIVSVRKQFLNAVCVALGHDR